MLKSPLQLYLQQCSDLKIRQNAYAVQQLNLNEQLPAKFNLESNSAQRLFTAEELKPCLKFAFEPLLKSFEQLSLLTDLNISGQHIGDRLFISLLGALKSSGCILQSFSAGYNDLSVLSVTLLFDYCDKKIQQIDISGNPIQDDALIYMAESKKHFRSTHLSLSNCQLTSNCLNNLSKCLRKTFMFVSTLDLSQNNLDSSDHSFNSYMELIEWTFSKNCRLNLSKNNLSRYQIHVIKNRISKGQLAQIDISENINADFNTMQQLEQQLLESQKWKPSDD
ncbi:Leucine-rich_repeat domain superfamily [Hexamita inflata]|uniref:Leucine-rich repeat domain superfamily n=1 Tax=Hexamita inflata TaxID=28002 RepID=A0AA86PA19_9EUKA|nr:Leucine-rich repeat domain superfamily [Hexamita inflata]